MGLIKLAVIGGAGYWAVKKYRNNQDKTQNPASQQQQQQYRDHSNHHPYQPDYYNHNVVRSADDDMYGPPSEKRQYSPHSAPEQLPHERPMQLNFVAPSEKTAAQVHRSYQH